MSCNINSSYIRVKRNKVKVYSHRFVFLAILISLYKLERSLFNIFVHRLLSGRYSFLYSVEQSRIRIYGTNTKKCFNYVNDYPAIKSMLSSQAIHHVRKFILLDMA